MEEKSFEINIITPERIFYSDEVDSIVFETIDGSRGVLKGASEQVFALIPSFIKITQKDVEFKASYGPGFIQIKKGKVLMMVETAEWPSEIDPIRAKLAIAENEEVLRLKKSHYEYTLGKANIARSLARLKVKSKED